MAPVKEPIAIIGSACRFPGSASSPSSLWKLLEDPVDVLSEFPADRLNLARFYHVEGEHHGRTDVQNKSYLLQEDCRHFDAPFFRISPKEAAALDPQQRILLESVYESLEAGGYTLDQMNGSQTSVYVGVMSSDFHDIQMRDSLTMPTYTATGLSRSILSNRISYFFNLKGPSVSLDTACSSSLVALHQAVQSLRNGESSTAIVAGATLLLDPGFYIAESKLHMLSPDSRSRMWDKDANGYARGEGCASIFLKPLSRAIQDGDHVECVIRETGVNSDGRTGGITMPDHASQAALIRQTYRNAGLDPVADRCQYFECHGTGTLAGDPVEARAIQSSFFPDDQEFAAADKLYCGSIKTVVGHLEGCAGLAGILKASLALQNATVPPNLLFQELNPAVRPFYDHLEVPTAPITWPEVATGIPRRASVNSFGFGGTNAHAILESPPSLGDIPEEVETSGPPGPFVFSARTGPSLLRTLNRYLEFLQKDPSVSPSHLAATLQSKRTPFLTRTSVAASSTAQLVERLEERINGLDKSPAGHIGTRGLAFDPHETPGILFAFTGQGAQWATMGRRLLLSSPTFRRSLELCESSLNSLPEKPTWSLLQELCAEDESSKLGDAVLSQPLCTAIQIALVDLLAASGIHPTAVIGHSSGEIAAVYAAGILNAKDAIRIAYYRGLVAHLARGPDGKPGAMMAVGMSFDQASDFCSRSEFLGRLDVAAGNSVASATLSGDADAIHEAKALCDSEGTFARLLKVEVAYHSRHMLSCANAYRELLERCEIQVNRPRADCWWSSSVRGDVELLEGSLETLKAEYWVQNMVQPVLYSHALESSFWHGGPFSLALELGPHPALKGPTSQTAKSVLGTTFPYYGCLQRGEDDAVAFATAFGAVWELLGPSNLDFSCYRGAFGSNSAPRVLKGLPSYSWDHDQVHWRESRMSHNHRLRRETPHELLGQRSPDDSNDDMRWRNMLDLAELPWAKGHQFQHQAIFPAAGYVSMAVEASRIFVEGHPISSIEIRDMAITKALTLEDDGHGVELLFSMRRDRGSHQGLTQNVIEAEFMGETALSNHTMSQVCTGKVLVHLNSQSGSGLSMGHANSARDLPAMDVDRFYKSVSRMGIDYTGIFRRLESINRTWGQSRASASWKAADIGDQYAVHPAILDVGFQSGFAAFLSTADDADGATYLPAHIRRIVVDLGETFCTATGVMEISTEAFVESATSKLLEIDINLGNPSTSRIGIQVEGLMLKAIDEPQAAHDRHLFAKTKWDIDVAHGLPDFQQAKPLPEELDLIDVIERTALYYFQTLLREIDSDEIPTFNWYHQAFFRAIETFLQPIRQHTHPVIQSEWLQDDYETIQRLVSKHPESVDLKLMRAVGENLASVVRGKTQMLQHMMEGNLLSRLYTEGRGFAMLNEQIARVMKHIVHKYPKANILEIGAGTGGTTSSVLDAIGDKYRSYTYTDISAGFFTRATERFSSHTHKMTFKVFNAEKSCTEQGFQEGGYDIIIAANVLHATRNLKTTMRHARALLRPGGYLIAMEVTGAMLREPFLMGALEGWWLGVDDGRFPSPGVSPKTWDSILQATGFSGIDTIVYDMPDVSRHDCSVFVARAAEPKYDALRDPLHSTHDALPNRAVIVGGKSLSGSKAVRTAERLLRPHFLHLEVVESLRDLTRLDTAEHASVLCMTDLDHAMFSSGTIDAVCLDQLQTMLGSARNVLWLTAGRLNQDPDSNMMIGIGRAMSFELPHMDLQFMDFDGPSPWNIEVASEAFLRLVLLSSAPYANRNMLWDVEPEIVSRGDDMLIPRIVSDVSANELLNASRRRVTRSAPPSCIVKLALSAGSFDLVEDPETLAAALESSVSLNMHYSVALCPGADHSTYLCVGSPDMQEGLAMFISDQVASRMSPPSSKILQLPATQVCGPKELANVSAMLAALSCMSSLPTSGRAIILNPDRCLVNAISRAAAIADRSILFVSAGTRVESENSLDVNPLASDRTIRRLLPKDASSVVTFPDSDSDVVLRNVSKDVPIRHFFRPAMEISIEDLKQAFELSTQGDQEYASSVISLADVHEVAIAAIRLPTVLSWLNREELQVVVRPVEAAAIFRSDRTYLLVGMTGELGRSLCQYMVRNGARSLVLASRSASEDVDWLTNLLEYGAVVKVIKMDITCKEQVSDTLALIHTNMPKLGGVANAALILEDAMFVNATAESIARQTRPKVMGTKHLDDLLQHTHLDFFVTFSSLGSVFGNAGQSIYHASNMYMASLTQQRRERGLAASIIHIGLIVDIGYVAKADRAGSRIEEHLRKLFYSPLSERDFHHLFCQAVIRGHPENPDADIIMGIQPFLDSPENEVKPQWYSNPRFSHLIVQLGNAKDALQGSQSTQSARRDLDLARTESDATKALQDLLSKKIEMLMDVPAHAIDHNLPMADLGLDSLLAVEIRSWLLKYIGVEVPLLKILGAQPMSTLCAETARKFLDLKAETNVDSPQSSGPDGEPEDQASIDGSSSDSSPNDFSATPSTTEQSAGDVSCGEPDDGLAASSQVYPSEDSASSALFSEADSDFECSKELLKASTDRQNFDHVQDLSFAQARLYFLQQYLPDPTTYNLTVHYEFDGALDLKRFDLALRIVLMRHEALRTCYFTEPGEMQPKQGIIHAPKYNFKHVKPVTKDCVSHELSLLRGNPWSLETGETFGATVVSHNEARHSLLFGYHHIAMDGMSWFNFLRELGQAYRGVLPALAPRQYRDFSRAELTAHLDGSFEASLDFWEQKLNPVPQVLPLLPLAKVSTRGDLQSAWMNHTTTTNLPADLCTKIADSSRLARATPFQFHLAVVQVIIANLLDVRDICIGVTDANRCEADAGSIGFFLNMLPMRFHVDKQREFLELVKNTTREVLAYTDHTHTPIDLILERLNMARSTSYSPLFQIAFNYRVGDMMRTPLGDGAMQFVDHTDARHAYDMAFNIAQTASGACHLQITANSSMYPRATSDLVMDAYLQVLRTVCANEAIPVGQCHLYSETAALTATSVGRGPNRSWKWPMNLTEQFSLARSTHPDRIAIDDCSTTATYAQLDQKANTVSAALLARGATSGSRIALLCEPSVDTYAGMLGIIRIGAVYVPLDLSLPVERHLKMLEASGCGYLLAHHPTLEAASNLIRSNEVLVNLSDVPQASASLDLRRADQVPSFCLFTSGTTSTPKGIMLSEAGVMNYAAAKSERLNLEAPVVLQQSSTGFDMAIAQAVNAFANGGTLLVAPRNMRGDPVALSRLMHDKEVTFTICTPSEYSALSTYGAESLKRCTQWMHACSGGEVVTRNLARQLRSLRLPHLTMTDCYGPTETSCAVSFRTIPLEDVDWDTDARSVGRPIANVSVYILDQQNHPLPAGFPGEICVGGCGVALGYLDSKSSMSRFLSDASLEESAPTPGLLYKTGDKGYLSADGSLHYLGRLDGNSTVKLRGLRIDLQEVASAVIDASSGGLSEAVVTVRGQPQFLVAHVVSSLPDADVGASCSQIRSAVELPRYMIPSMIIPVDRLPRTVNGKVDLNAVQRLPLPARDPSGLQSERLSVPEGELRLLWLDILPREASAAGITANSDFFEAGGSSLLLVILRNAIKDKMGVDISLGAMYRASTLQSMAALVHDGRSGTAPHDPIDWEAETQLSPELNLPRKNFETTMRSGRAHIILTGATGFLGSSILQHLLQDEDVIKVHCIALSTDGATSLSSHDKICAYTGNLQSANLGFSNAEIDFLKENVQQIIHASSVGHCLNNYMSVRAANYASTQFLASLALDRMIPLHFISSNRVPLLSGSTIARPISMAAHPPPSDGSQGLTAAKWASEVFLERLSNQHGLPVVIHRACAATGDLAPHDDALNSLLRFSILMRAVPVLPNAEGYMDFKPVETLAAEIVETVRTKPEGTVFIHHSSGVQVPATELADHLGQLYGMTLETLPVNDWLQHAVKLGMETLIESYIHAVVVSGQKLTFPFLSSM